MNWLIALVALASMEIVLGIDNIVFIAIVTGKLPVEQQPKARFWGLALAMIMRVLLLLTLTWIMKLDEPFLMLTDWLPASLFAHLDHPEEVTFSSSQLPAKGRRRHSHKRPALLRGYNHESASPPCPMSIR